MRAFIGDEIVSNGHALFDNGQVRDGYILHLEQHLDRMYKGAKNIRMDSNMPHTRDEIRQIVKNVVALSQSRNCAIRYFLSGGVNGKEPQFYIILEEGVPVKPIDGTKDFTFVNPFEKDELMRMKTTNNIELCTFKKIISEKNKLAFGIIQRSDQALEVQNYLQTLNDSILILAIRDQERLNFHFEGGVKRVDDDKLLLIQELSQRGHAIHDNQKIVVFRDDEMTEFVTNFVGLFRLEESRVFQISSINETQLPLDEDTYQILNDAWTQVLSRDILII
ncbi:branched-chain-amino-acid aminotransferase-like protein chloroplastic-like [Stylonychia lemnae]|uniref:Branched-chain-amino-acid aminotransferase-like protein chloroplastic-like n=1 Tax=Stylonychia lemnae TaxID=5949 RepID=A0A078ASN6_STYLE|nr:branched-chain-amino-acid aminotransferase-like protein chloroplastic-like [Stylonychia lemnae]|eukprot:CDW84217.1 branched-chain-amino-acid aminotransferase-like protein chloroplastic-like [Stylonychia lemnae]